MRRAVVNIRGVTPLLMHRMAPTPSELAGVWNNVERATDAEREAIAWHGAYTVPGSRQLVIPGDNLQRCLISGGSSVKTKGRGNASKSVGAGVQIEEEYFLLEHETPVLDTRYRVIPATKGRTLVVRLKIPAGWKTTFSFMYDETLPGLTTNEVASLVGYAGARVGLMDWRPEKKGPYGRFEVLSYNECAID